MAEVEPDPVTFRDADVPRDALVVSVGLGETGGGEAAVHARHVLAQRDTEQREKDKRTTAAVVKNKKEGAMAAGLRSGQAETGLELTWSC